MQSSMANLALALVTASLRLLGAHAAGAGAGITGVTRGPSDLSAPSTAEEGEYLRYGLGFPFQIAPYEAGLFCNLRVEGQPAVDFENGSDLITFSNLAAIEPARAIVVARNERHIGPDTGAQRLVVKYPVIGGFVPQGALRSDGSPHPHAGTGFGICQAISFPTDERGLFSWDTERVHGTEVYQLSYDGREFRSEQSASAEGGEHPSIGDSGWKIVAPGITNAVPDSDDLLQPVHASGEGAVSGVARWRCIDGVWRPTQFLPVTPPGENWQEPSLARDVDGNLLFCARGYGGDFANRVRVWRSTDAGAAWQLVVDEPGVREEAPISLNAAVNGTPFIGASPLGRWRQTLCIWPLNAGRTGLGEPLVLRDARVEFGEAPSGAAWMVDHPSAAVVRLADGEWHCVLAYRILDHAEHKGANPPPQTGCYLEEVLSAGEPVAPWRFE